jgi:hypothetical protein
VAAILVPVCLGKQGRVNDAQGIDSLAPNFCYSKKSATIALRRL